MPLDGSGFYSLPTPAFPAVPNTLIASADFNTVLNDIAQVLSNCLYRDGQAIPNGDFDLGNNKIIRLAAGTAATDAVNFGQLSALETSLETLLETLLEDVEGISPSVIFPVGAIYITAGNTNPGTFLGGTWTQVAEGRTLIGVGTLSGDTYAAGATGGAASVSLTIGQMPAHDHGGATGVQSADHTHSGTVSSAGGHTHATNIREAQESGTSTGNYQMTVAATNAGAEIQTDSAGAHTHTITTGNNSVSHTHVVSEQGGGQAHENRMPYLAVYFWQRTA